MPEVPDKKLPDGQPREEPKLDPRDMELINWIGARRLFALRFATTLYVISISWIFWYDPAAPNQLGATISSLLQNAIVFGLYLAIDSRRILPGPRFVLAGLATVYAIACVADTFLLSLLGTPVAQVVSILFATGSPLTALTWAEVTPLQAAWAVVVMSGAFVVGGWVHRRMPRFAAEKTQRVHFNWVMLGLVMVFLGEHAWSRTTSAYLSRTSFLPLYVRLLPPSVETSYAIRLAPPISEEDRRRALADIEPLDDPPHVLYILLESFRGDTIDPQLTPNMYGLSHEGLNFERANTEGILTSLSWNVILLDRPSFRFHYDVRTADYESLAAWPLEILHAAGYRVVVSSSTDMVANHYERRLRGTNDTVASWYMAYDMTDTARHRWDDDATANLVGWIEAMDIEQPQFMLYQLDSTHWDYYFHEDDAPIEPYSEIVRPMSLRDQGKLDLVYNRYLNAAAHVDKNIGRVLEALRARGVLDDTVVILVADHGEAFRVGRVGHSVLHPETRRIPIIMKLPGVEPADLPTLISTRNIYPTVFDYLGITGVGQELMLGSSALPPASGDGATLTMHGSGGQADLVLDDRVFRFDVRQDEQNIIFTPTAVLDHEDSPLGPLEDHLRAVDWRGHLDRLVGTGGRP